MNITLIGAGPRNLALLPRLIAHANQSSQATNIKIIDPFGIGGRVWRVEQDPNFLMNTVTSQLTLFTDDTIQTYAPVILGPNFYQWAKQYGIAYIQKNNFMNAESFFDEIAKINPNRFSSRALFGVYTKWFYDQLLTDLPQHIHIQFIQQSVTEVHPLASKQFNITIKDGQNFTTDEVVMALGHVDQSQSLEEINLADYAKDKQLTYVPAGHPSEANLQQIKSNEPVILRGLGLSFFDYIAKLTIGRGGKFIRNQDAELIYQPSGQEPKIIAGSRHGIPLHARGTNQKISGNGYQPRFFTPATLDHFAEQHHGEVTFDFFMKLIKKEISYKHYLNIISDLAVTWPFNAKEFLDALANSNDIDTTAHEWGLPEELIMDWDLILHPFTDATAENYQEAFISYLKWDINDAKQGNVDAPYAGAFDILRDIRSVIRHYVLTNYLNDQEYPKFLREFNPFNNIISVGPPVLRVEQMHALMQAGILTITGPQIKITTQQNQFVATDVFGNQYPAVQLVEARLHGINMNTSTNPLVQNLVKDQLISTKTYQEADGTSFEVGGAMINRTNMTLVSQQNQEIPGLRMWGVTTEGWSWFTTFSPRPNVHDKILQDAENIANTIFAKL
ncbi:FAD/NAD(P)-binding protein [Weissella koreensis]|uniref:FAD/NAD(P)-binding protein n=1 Tax=Weissella koreensis TaxID=165096 RepID=A0A7H1MM21_9LACO|nr:FAD/NAD(P)-binding protein [Weissella koreensis]EJF34801.1 FAD(NAD)-dependent oxidoreductase [Weissella koreensis KCTC 3621]QGN20529.1 oxidoreductase [Weissella koreensis]QNT64507.1 FAD/NAD(P)-binding protein [Weissella koreensis]